MKKITLFIVLPVIFILLNCGVVDKLANKDPIINEITATPQQIGTQDTTLLKVVAEDPDGDLLSYNWDNHSNGELLETMGDEVHWLAPNASGQYKISVKVTDENGGKVSGDIIVKVKGDESPIVTITQPVENQIVQGIGYYTVKAEVVFDWSVEHVKFFLNGDSLMHTDQVVPFEYENWYVSNLYGQQLITAIVYEKGDLTNFGADSVHVFIEGIVPVPK